MSPTQVEIQKVLVLSTAHVSYETSRKLDAGEVSLPVARWEYGWFVWVDEAAGDDSLQNVPADLEATLAFAKHLGCEWVRFDADGHEIEELPRFEWPVIAPA